MNIKNEIFDPSGNIFDAFEPNQISASSQLDFYATSV